MARTSIHTCTFFDDGDPELLCGCGVRAVLLVDDEAPDGLLAVLLDDADLPVGVALAEARPLAASA